MSIRRTPSCAGRTSPSSHSTRDESFVMTFSAHCVFSKNAEVVACLVGSEAQRVVLAARPANSPVSKPRNV
jgi:hypothetical protein